MILIRFTQRLTELEKYCLWLEIRAWKQSFCRKKKKENCRSRSTDMATTPPAQDEVYIQCFGHSHSDGMNYMYTLLITGNLLSELLHARIILEAASKHSIYKWIIHLDWSFPLLTFKHVRQAQNLKTSELKRRVNSIDQMTKLTFS